MLKLAEVLRVWCQREGTKYNAVPQSRTKTGRDVATRNTLIPKAKTPCPKLSASSKLQTPHFTASVSQEPQTSQTQKRNSVAPTPVISILAPSYDNYEVLIWVGGLGLRCPGFHCGLCEQRWALKRHARKFWTNPQGLQTSRKIWS